MFIDLPYDSGRIQLSIVDERVAGILTVPGRGTTGRSQEDIIRDALRSPIGSKPLSELAVGKNKVVVITSDHTRAVPSALTLPLLLEEVRKGNPDADITVLVATGLHRGMTPEEMKAKFGEAVCASERIVNHDAYDTDGFVDLGVLPSGSKCEISRLATEADLLVSEGFIEPHFFAGFSGGRKSVLPGVASQDCVNINHSASAIQHPRAATGVLSGNPIHEDMIKAARMANLAFIFNVLLDEEKRVIAAFCGDADAAHRAGCEFLLDRSGVDPVKADIVVTTNGGYPLDQNLYQCPKGLDAALACVNDGGVIILVAACKDGLGGENFGRMMLEGTPRELLDRILATAPEKTVSEQWCVQRFADALIKYRIILVTAGIDRATVERMNFIYAETVDEALCKAYELTGPRSKVAILPDGVSVIVRR
ncbi:MAG: lactate racemization operon protein LarA [Spirochaetae bacterium HGW-Spirochaetae-3]|nr:MAG: lactate racemization operon protein LarA [Spirochaetae bacterium HGW-Spirochaetae-3]